MQVRLRFGPVARNPVEIVGIPIKKKIDSYQIETDSYLKNINSYQKENSVLLCWFPGRLVLGSLCPGPLVPWSLGPLEAFQCSDLVLTDYVSLPWRNGPRSTRTISAEGCVSWCPCGTAPALREKEKQSER